MNRTETAIALVEANRKLDAYASARAEGFSIAKSRLIAQYGTPGRLFPGLDVDDAAGTANLVESGRGWSIVNDLADVSDLHGGKDWLA